MKKRSFWLYRKIDTNDSKIEKETEQLNKEELNDVDEKETQISTSQRENIEEQIKNLNQQINVDTTSTMNEEKNANITNETKTRNQQKGNTFREILRNWNISEQSNNIQNTELLQRNTNNRVIINGFELKSEQVQISDAVINNLVDNFINKRFQTRESQLNARQDSTVIDYGFEKWNTMQLVKHKVTKEYGKMLKDKYGYKKDEKKSETIPLSFYFDLSGSMNEYSHILSLIALKILQKKIKLLIGYNNNIVYKIDELPKEKNISVEEFQSGYNNNIVYKIDELPKEKNISVEEFQSILDEKINSKKIKNEKIKYEIVNQQLDKYLLENGAEKVTLFTDFDPIEAIRELSQKTELYWFCFEKYKTQPFNFKGRFFTINKLEDIIFYMKNIDKPYIKKDEEELWR